jgi:hypothetical protein
MRPWLLGVVCGLAVAIGLTWVGILAARFVLHGPVDAVSLAESVSLYSGGSGEMFGIPPCEPAGAAWDCRAEDDPGSGPSATYRVTVRDGSSCWDAHIIAQTGSRLPANLAGCVHAWQWTLWDLL